MLRKWSKRRVLYSIGLFPPSASLRLQPVTRSEGGEDRAHFPPFSLYEPPSTRSGHGLVERMRLTKQKFRGGTEFFRTKTIITKGSKIQHCFTSNNKTMQCLYQIRVLHPGNRTPFKTVQLIRQMLAKSVHLIPQAAPSPEQWRKRVKRDLLVLCRCRKYYSKLSPELGAAALRYNAP